MASPFPHQRSQQYRPVGLLLTALLSVAFPFSMGALSDELPQGSGWSRGGMESLGSTAQEGFKVTLEVPLKGRASEAMDRITLEGEMRIRDSRLDSYFKQKEREYRSSGGAGGMRAMAEAARQSRPERLSAEGSAREPGRADSMHGNTWGEDWGEPQASLLQGHFKLLRLQPFAITTNVTAELYLGENGFSPHLEALEVRLNPFKSTRMEVVLSGFTKADLRKARVIVDLDGPVKPEWKDREFSAVFRCELQVGESFGGYGYGFDEETEIQWVEEPESAEESVE